MVLGTEKTAGDPPCVHKLFPSHRSAELISCGDKTWPVGDPQRQPCGMIVKTNCHPGCGLAAVSPRVVLTFLFLSLVAICMWMCITHGTMTGHAGPSLETVRWLLGLQSKYAHLEQNPNVTRAWDWGGCEISCKALN